MNNRRQLVMIIIGVAIFVGLLILAALSMGAPKTSQATVLTYTDNVTGQVRDIQPNAATDLKYSEVVLPEPSLVSVAGTDDLYEKIGITLANTVNDQITAFVRAHGGPGFNEAAIVGAKYKNPSNNPTVYTFEMITKWPETKYLVTVTMQDNDLVAPSVKIEEEAQ